ncbi:MAG: cbb3-type cytochrome c oxidase subunit II [Gemmatimonadaceae bacterium]|jgi:cytochrome c oxidase cbb3-type subunit 2|nr:cbb3-type cytochrome c oxidase subunit II [Gemmatimonadaceae bacterium]
MSGARQVDVLRLGLGALFIIAFAITALVVMPYATLKDVPPPSGLKAYTEQQLRGRQIYIANGCIYCHSQQPRDPSIAPDQARGWGRPSVPADYVIDKPHLLGTMRTGPDLFNIAVRQPSEAWHLGHLYQPRAYLEGSIMPAYPFLFEERTGPAQPGETVVSLPPAYAKPGVRIVPTPEAIDLVAYLLALDRSYPVLPAEARR